MIRQLPFPERSGFPAGRKAQALRKLTVDERLYYTTRYGSSLAYSRPLELLAGSGLKDIANKRILDYGYGAIGHLRLLVSLGAGVVVWTSTHF